MENGERIMTGDRGVGDCNAGATTGGETCLGHPNGCPKVRPFFFLSRDFLIIFGSYSDTPPRILDADVCRR